MCGIVAVTGLEETSAHCVAGLRRLQYRGYDSYGFAWTDGRHLDRLRSLEPLDDMQEDLPDSTAAVGHTRWATHGAVTLENCHPHIRRVGGFGNDIALAHNGIVENYQTLRDSVGCCESDTDSEVILRLLERELERHDGDRIAAMMQAFAALDGRNTIVVLFADGQILGLRYGSPLVLGRSSDRRSHFLASDMLSFSPWASECCAVPDNMLVIMDPRGANAMSLDGRQAELCWTTAEAPREQENVGLDGYRHYMLKEVMEQWRTIPRQAVVTSAELAELVGAMHSAERVVVTGAGGASYTAQQIAWLLRTIAGVDALAVAAYEIESMQSCVSPGDVLLAISQSGETADTIDAVRCAIAWGMRIATLINMPFSTLARLSALNFCNRSGPEICVLSTKSASAQMTFGYLLACALAGDRELKQARTSIDGLSRALTDYLDDATTERVRAVAERIAGKQHVFVVGRGAYFAPALIGALNIKEASYLHAEAFAAGELKHGVIALIEPEVPVIVFVPRDDPYMVNVVAEVKSRGAFVIALAESDNELFDVRVPLPSVPEGANAVAAVIPCQLLAYYLAVTRGVNPDRPRNLAKSVTVR